MVVGWALLGAAVTPWPWLAPVWWWAGLLVLVVGFFDAAALWLLRRLVVVRVVPGRFALNRPGVVRVTLTNRDGWPARVQIFDGVPETAEATQMPWSGRVAGRSNLRVEHDVRMIQRGRAVFGPVHVLRFSLFGLWARATREGASQETKVYPDYEPVVRFALLAMDHQQSQMGIVLKNRAGMSRDFHQLRDYQRGDGLAQIDWKASSRHMKMISRDYQEQRDQTVIFLIDTGRRMRALDGELPQFDHCLNALLLLSYVALRQGDSAGVLSFGGTERWLAPVKGAHSMTTLLNHLYDYQTTPHPSDFQEAAKRLLVRQKRRALVVVLTNLRGEDAGEIVPSLKQIGRRHLVLVANLRERFIDERLERPVTALDEALIFGATRQYVDERKRVAFLLESSGVLMLDATAAALPVALANKYLDIKASGRL
jgi:uncharacterized protein (DUF58 family)